MPELLEKYLTRRVRMDVGKCSRNLTGIILLTFIMFRTLKQPYGNSLRAKEVLGIDNL